MGALFEQLLRVDLWFFCCGSGGCCGFRFWIINVTVSNFRFGLISLDVTGILEVLVLVEATKDLDGLDQALGVDPPVLLLAHVGQVQFPRLVYFVILSLAIAKMA